MNFYEYIVGVVLGFGFRSGDVYLLRFLGLFFLFSGEMSGFYWN